MSLVSQIMKDGVGRHFLKKALEAGFGPLSFLESPFEEQDHERMRREAKGQKGPVMVHSMGSGGQSSERRDDNYLYSTRRFPGNTTNNTIGSGALAAGDFPYFTTGINDQGNQMGYASIPQLTYQQTNMGPKGQIPKGQAYEMNQMGISFNASAKVADVLALLDASTLTFNMQQGAYLLYQGPIALWPGGTGPWGFAAAATTATTTTINVQGATNGLPSPASIRTLNWIRYFGETDMFQYTLTQTAALPADNSTIALSNFTEIRIQLFGLYRSSIPQ